MLQPAGELLQGAHVTAGGHFDAELGRLGRYTLLRRLGEGGMGEVFLAKAEGAAGFETKVCIKRIVPHLAHETDFIERFVAEGKLVSQLRHPGIAQVIDLGEADGTFFLAMEYVDGYDLRTMMRHARAAELVPQPEVLTWILCRVLEALDYAHRQGIVHRDVSPSNVMVGRSGDVKLVDFGLALPAATASVPSEGRAHGKVGYMSPEQASGKAVDGRSDIFSLGITAWELFRGQRPFQGETDRASLELLATETPKQLVDVVDGVSSQLSDAIGKMLAKAPEQRFQTADLARRALAAHLSEETVGAREVADWFQHIERWHGPSQTPSGVSLDGALGLGLERVASEAREHTVSVVATNAPWVPESVDSSAPPSQSDRSDFRESGSKGWFYTLVILNMALLSAVAWLVLWPSETATTPDSATVTGRPSAPSATLPSDAQAANTTRRAVNTPDIGKNAMEQPTFGSLAGRTLSTIVMPSSPAAASSGKGGDDAAPRQAQPPKRVSVTVFAKPRTASILVRGHGRPAKGRLALHVMHNTVVTGEVSASGYKTRSFEIKADKTKRRTIELSKAESGILTFRYFPAAANIRIDGQPAGSADTNVVRVHLTPGNHVLTIDYQEKRRRIEFQIESNKTTNLKTVRLN